MQFYINIPKSTKKTNFQFLKHNTTNNHKTKQNSNAVAKIQNVIENVKKSQKKFFCLL